MSALSKAVFPKYAPITRVTTAMLAVCPMERMVARIEEAIP